MTEPLVLVPGHLCDQAMWAHQRAHLADLAAVSIASTVGSDTMAGMARAVLAAAPPRFALAGLSMGGYIALEIMRQAPARVTRLALVDTMASLGTPAAAERRRQMIALLEAGRFDEVLAIFTPLLVHQSRLSDMPLMDELARMTRRIGPKAALDQQRAMLARPDSLPGLARITCPAVVICGRQDVLTPLAESETMAAGIPGAKLVAIEDCGHMSTMERPQAVTAVLRYWLQA